MSKKEIIADACTVAGASVGVGFLSGKEAQTFLGNFANVAVFGICFFVFCLVLREFCRKKCCATVSEFSVACFGRYSAAYFAILCMCCFVCAVTALAGLEDCLTCFLPSFPLPAYAFATAVVSAWVMKKGIKTLKILNVAQMIMAAVYISIMIFETKKVASAANVLPHKAIIYALFDVTVCVGVLAPLSQNKKQNIAATAAAAMLLCALLCIALWAGDFSREMPLFCFTDNIALNIFLALTLVIATVTGVVANLLPVVGFAETITEDRGLATLCVFCLAVAFSVFGFDFALKYGYVFVAIFGAVTLIAIRKNCRPFEEVSAVPPKEDRERI